MEFTRSLIGQVRGLMFRRELPDGHALVFVFPSSRKVSLHMLFVPFPIEVLFLDANKRIVKSAYLRAWTGLATSGEEAKYVIEMPAGVIHEHHLSVGDQILFEEP
ncbi:MAG: DUF192 domain-containing protein [Euryarchaeota archaeon]|nr:DUF192 domain-containing protein [Euryarchaeota archaeon]